MQMHIRLEGTAKEIGDALRTLSSTAAFHTTALELDGHTAAESESPPTEETPFVTTRFARRALTRLPLSEPMKNVLEALCGAHPDWLSAPELQKAAGYNPSQFAGLMGAFGRRLANTEGYEHEAHFWEWEWRDDKDTWECRLPDSVYEAVREIFHKTGST